MAGNTERFDSRTTSLCGSTDQPARDGLEDLGRRRAVICGERDGEEQIKRSADETADECCREAASAWTNC